MIRADNRRCRAGEQGKVSRTLQPLYEGKRFLQELLIPEYGPNIPQPARKHERGFFEVARLIVASAIGKTPACSVHHNGSLQIVQNRHRSRIVGGKGRQNVEIMKPVHVLSFLGARPGTNVAAHAFAQCDKHARRSYTTRLLLVRAASNPSDTSQGRTSMRNSSTPP